MLLLNKAIIDRSIQYIYFSFVVLVTSIMISCTPFKDYTECQKDTDCPQGLFYCSNTQLCTRITEEADLNEACPISLNPLVEGQTLLALFAPLTDENALHIKTRSIEGITLADRQINELLKAERVPGINWLICDSSQQSLVKQGLDTVKRYNIKLVMGDLYRQELKELVHQRLQEKNFSQTLWLANEVLGIESMDPPPNLLYGHIQTNAHSTAAIYLALNIINTYKDQEEIAILVVWNTENIHQSLLAAQFNQAYESMKNSSIFSKATRLIELAYTARSEIRFDELESFLNEATEDLAPIQVVYFLDQPYLQDLQVYQEKILNLQPNSQAPLHMIVPQWSLHPDLLAQENLGPFTQMNTYTRWGISSTHYPMDLFSNANPAQQILQEINPWLVNTETSSRTIYTESDTHSVYDLALFASLVTLYSKLIESDTLTTAIRLSNVDTYQSEQAIYLSQKGLQDRPITLYDEESWHIFGATGPIIFNFNTQIRQEVNQIPGFFCQLNESMVEFSLFQPNADTGYWSIDPIIFNRCMTQ
jgi:hypothetical protein